MLENLDYTLAEGCIEVFENEMRIRLADSAFTGVGEVVAEEDIVQGERRCWAVWQVRDCESCWNTAVLMKKK